jgi:heptosyltransferase III
MSQAQNNFSVIISRTDSLGDVVLTLPIAGIIKKYLPDCKIIFLGRNYSKALVSISKHVDTFISYDDILELSKPKQIDFFKKVNASHIIHVFPVKHIADLASKAKITNRIGTSSRIWHWWTCNMRVELSRKNSDLHEAQLNAKLLSPLNIPTDFSKAELSTFFGFEKLPQPDEAALKYISETKTNIILHAKSKGSAREWGLDNFATLIQQLDKDKYQILITGTEAEGEMVRAKLVQPFPHVIDTSGKLSLAQFIWLISKVQVIVAASTGPLHIASALGKKAIGLYAPMRPLFPQRWGPLGIDAHALVKQKDCSDCKKRGTCQCILDIHVNEVLALLK